MKFLRTMDREDPKRKRDERVIKMTEDMKT